MIYGKLPIVILSALAAGQAGSVNEQIARYILHNMGRIRRITIAELAEQCHVSMSSISRFCREIGLSSFAELSRLLSTVDLTFEPLAAEEPSPRVRGQQYIEAVKTRMDKVAQSLDYEKLALLSRDIDSFENLAVFGLLKAGTAAQNLQSDLLLLGKPSVTTLSPAQQMAYIEQATERDLIIIFSFTGIYFDYYYLRRPAALRRPRVYFITADADVREDAYLNRVITFASDKDQISHPYQLQLIASLIAQNYAWFLAQKESIS